MLVVERHAAEGNKMGGCRKQRWRYLATVCTHCCSNKAVEGDDHYCLLDLYTVVGAAFGNHDR